jgi:hypothetical protein
MQIGAQGKNNLIIVEFIQGVWYLLMLGPSLILGMSPPWRITKHRN